MRLAAELDLDPDVVLAMAGKVSRDLREAIMRRPQLFAQLIRELKDMPDRAVQRLVREVREASGETRPPNVAEGVMVELKGDALVFSFPEVHEDAALRIEFQRTLRTRMRNTRCRRAWARFRCATWTTSRSASRANGSRAAASCFPCTRARQCG